jgi:hypothetical protein
MLKMTIMMMIFVRFQALTAASLQSSGLQRRVVSLELTDVSEVRTASCIMIHRPDDGGSTHLCNVGPR